MSIKRKPRNKEWTTVKLSVKVSYSELKRIFLATTGNTNPSIAELRKVRMKDIQTMFEVWCISNCDDY